MCRALSVILHIIAGFFFYMVSLLGFFKEPATGAKLVIMLGFTVPAVIFLFGGLALTRFRNWKRDAGIVLLSATGFTAFLIFTFACMLMTEEFRTMMQPETMDVFSDYITGGTVMVGLAALGLVLLKANKTAAGQGARSDSENTAARS